MSSVVSGPRVLSSWNFPEITMQGVPVNIFGKNGIKIFT